MLNKALIIMRIIINQPPQNILPPMQNISTLRTIESVLLERSVSVQIFIMVWTHWDSPHSNSD